MPSYQIYGGWLMLKTRAGEVVGTRVTETKAGWRVKEWARDTGLSRAYIYNLLAAGDLDSVKIGSARIITTTPAEFLRRHAMSAD